MTQEVLKQIGLNDQQIAAYIYLLDHGPTSPPDIAQKLKFTRSNAYKILDQLLEIGLVSRGEAGKKLAYKAEDPIALASIVAEERNRVLALEKNVKIALEQLRAKYQKSSNKSEVQTYVGSSALKLLYEHQARLRQPVYFVKTREDIPTMGFEAMDYIRRLPAKFNVPLFGITQDSPEGSANPELDRQTNLIRTWVPAEDYTAPVEWAVAGDELTIFNFSGQASAIRVKNQVVADAFRQLWHIMDIGLRAQPNYNKLPVKAKRRV